MLGVVLGTPVAVLKAGVVLGSRVDRVVPTVELDVALGDAPAPAVAVPETGGLLVPCACTSPIPRARPRTRSVAIALH